MTGLTRRGAWAVAIVAMLTMTVSYIDRTTLAVLAPTVTKALDISEAGYGWLTSAFSLAYLFATPLAGQWIDRIGARRGLVASVLVWSTVAALHAVVPGFGVLLAMRIALGVAEGPSFPGAIQTVQRVLPVGDHPRGFGLMFTGSSIGGMLVPPLASWLYGLGGWRIAFLGTALIGLSWIPLWILITGRPKVSAKLDLPPDVELAPRPSFGALVRHPLMIRALLAIVAVAPVVAFLTAWGAKYLVGEFGVQQADVGQYLWLPPLLLDLGLLGFGDLAARQRRAPGAPPRLLFAIAMILAAGLVVLPLAQTPWQVMLIGGLAMTGGGGIYTLALADVLSRVPRSSVALAAGIVAIGQSVALIIVNPVIGFAVDTYGNYVGVVIALGAWVIPGSLAWLVWHPTAHYTRA